MLQITERASERIPGKEDGMRGGHLISLKKDSHECQSIRPSVKGAPHSQKEAKVSSPPSAEASKGRKFALGGGGQGTGEQASGFLSSFMQIEGNGKWR